MRILNDFTGREIELPENLGSIISLNPSITETLCLLGLEKKLKGVSAFCRRPASVTNIRKIGSYSTYNEKIVDEINPDIIFTISGYQNELTKQLVKKYNVFQFELPSTPFGILDMVNRVGIVSGNIREAQNLVNNLWRNYDPPVKKTRSYIEIDLGGPVSFGSLSYITSTLNYYGMQTPFDSESREWIEPDYNRVKEFDPEIMIFEGKMYRGATVDDVKKRIGSTPLSETSAYRNDRIYCTPGKLDFFAHHGPSFFSETLPWLKMVIEAA